MIRPTRGKILCRIIDKDTQTKGGIYLAQSNKKEYPERAKVLAVGLPRIGRKGKELKPAASTGNVVYIKRGSGDRFKIDGEDLIILRNDNIVAKA